MEEPGEQCTVVFALIVTEHASECVCGGGGGRNCYAPLHPPPPLLNCSVTIYGKTTVQCAILIHE
jgi:hypothetical protein